MTLTTSGIDSKVLISMFRTMITIRRFAEQSKREADSGKLRGLHSSIGQEAVPTGMCAHLGDKDFIFGTIIYLV